MGLPLSIQKDKPTETKKTNIKHRGRSAYIHCSIEEFQRRYTLSFVKRIHRECKEGGMD